MSEWKEWRERFKNGKTSPSNVSKPFPGKFFENESNESKKVAFCETFNVCDMKVSWNAIKYETREKVLERYRWMKAADCWKYMGTKWQTRRKNVIKRSFFRVEKTNEMKNTF